MKPRGIILYRGKSQLDGKPIVCIATFSSHNKKTGKMVQTWILVDNGDKPTNNQKTKDQSICGDCIHRNGSCYVNVGQAPNAVYRTFLAGKYEKFSLKKHGEMFLGQVIRLGSYGDPAAVPIKVWQKILKLSKHHTGYTHQWRNPEFQSYRTICMASLDCESDYKTALDMGWRTFRVKFASENKLEKEFVCPASAEMNKKKTCETCKACQGFNEKKPGLFNVVINAHGLDWKVKRFEAAREERKTLLSLSLV